jgi:pimeloyl-ACP methyl ester carboxylesterase
MVGRPTVLFLHGFTDDGSVWAPTIRRNRWHERYDVVTPSAIGHGGRPYTGGPLGLDELATDVSEQCPAGPCVVVAHSMGCLVAARFAAREPGRVTGAVLEDPPWGVRAEPDEIADEIGTWIRGLQSTDHDGRLGWLDATHPGWPADERDPWAASKAAVDARLFGVRSRWMGEPWEDDFAALPPDGLVVTGEVALGAILTDAVVEQARALQPSFGFHRLAGAGHDVRRDRPGEYGRLVDEFLRRVTGIG